MRKQRTITARTAELLLADFGYDFPAPATPFAGPVIASSELRQIGQEVIDEYTPTQGRHVLDDAVSRYQDLWAKRYWRSQAGIERGRLDRGFAKHRAHREPFPLQAPDGAE